MALDSLLAMRKTGVSGVSQVQANNGGLFADTPADSAKVSGVSDKRIAPGADTSDTPCNPMRYQAKPLLSLVCTPDASDTSQNTNAEESAACFGWLIHFLDRDPMYVTFSPEVDHAGAMAGYPDAVAAEPIPETPKRSATPDETIELTRLIEAVYRDDTEGERCEALDAALADPEPALICYRAIALERGIILPHDDGRRTCRQCASFTYGGVCSIAVPGGPVSANRGYRPAPDLLQRCEGYRVKP